MTRDSYINDLVSRATILGLANTGKTLKNRLKSYTNGELLVYELFLIEKEKPCTPI